MWLFFFRIHRLKKLTRIYGLDPLLSILQLPVSVSFSICLDGYMCSTLGIYCTTIIFLEVPSCRHKSERPHHHIQINPVKIMREKCSFIVVVDRFIFNIMRLVYWLAHCPLPSNEITEAKRLWKITFTCLFRCSCDKILLQRALHFGCNGNTQINTCVSAHARLLCTAHAKKHSFRFIRTLRIDWLIIFVFKKLLALAFTKTKMNQKKPHAPFLPLTKLNYFTNFNPQLFYYYGFYVGWFFHVAVSFSLIAFFTAAEHTQL